MNDITPQLRSFIARRAAWASGDSLGIAKALARAIGARIDWDERAGENWIRVIADTRVVALISTLGPLTVMVDEAAGVIQDYAGPHPEIVIVSSVEDVVLRADREVLLEAFGERVRNSPAFDPACFSAEDLWFISV
jgi:hypothetical protein